METEQSQAAQVTPRELCLSALKHYDELSTKASSWMNQLPQAISFWYLEKPILEAERDALKASNAELAAALCNLLNVAEMSIHDPLYDNETAAMDLARAALAKLQP